MSLVEGRWDNEAFVPVKPLRPNLAHQLTLGLVGRFLALALNILFFPTFQDLWRICQKPS